MLRLQVVALLLSVSEVISQCPPSSGIYLRYNGNCYPNGSYFWDARIKSTSVECVLPGATLNGGQWIGPNGAVPCDGGDNANVQCTTGPGTNLSVFINPSNYLGAPGDGWYKCCLPTNCSDPNTNIIFANIFNFAQIESFTVADLPSDMTIYPQEYKLNCTKIGYQYSYNIRIGFDNTTLASYTGCVNNCPGTVLDIFNYKLRYTVNITWDGMTISSGSISQSTTGDQMYQCVLAVTNQPTRIRSITIKVPDTAPSSLAVVNKTATTITVSWTALDSSDADGYVINVTSDTDTVQTVQVEGSSNNTITLNGLRELTTYSITVRAYQQLLGPPSTISVFTHCQQGGIYFKHNGNCHQNGSYFWDNTVNAVTEAISCVLPGTSLTTGQWVRVADPDDPVDCNSNNANDPFRCTSVTSPDATLNLYLAQGLSGTQEGWYKCCLPTDCSAFSTNIIIANIFRFAEIELFTVADLPSDMTVYPQQYKLDCTKIGHSLYGISMSIGSTTLASYTNCDDHLNDCPGAVLVSSTNTRRYTVNITWDGMTVSSQSSHQSITGDQMYQCVLDNPSGGDDRTRTLAIKVPATAPSFLTEVNKTATTITVSWTALDSSDADGYVVNVTSDTDTVQTAQVEGSSNNTITLNGLRAVSTYNITVRAYQQLLGPASTISVQTFSEYLSGPVGSVSSIMDTTWAVISWSVPSYIPSDYPIITYEIGYHILFDRLCCSIVNDNDIDIQMLQLYNSTSGSTFINITGLNDKSCYIFGVRAYTDRGPGNWRVIANETLVTTQEVCLGSTNIASHAIDGTSIGLVAVVGLLLISLVISIIIHIYCLIKLKSYYTVSPKETNKFNIDAIPMQACEPYNICKTNEIRRDAEYEDINVDDAN